MFKLQESFLEQYKGKQPKWGFNGLGYVIYKRTYSRPYCGKCESYIIDQNTEYEYFCTVCGSKNIKYEEWWKTLQRAINGTFELQRRHIDHLRTKWDSGRAQASAQEMFELMWDFKFSFPGRGLFAMGSPLVMDFGNAACLYSCGFASTRDIGIDFTQPFNFLFMASALGVGVGFDTRGAGKTEIVKSAKSEEIFVIPDSREGWSEALRKVLSASNGRGSLPKFDYSIIRPFGARIKTFGGTASGPEALRELLEEDLPEVLSRKYNTKISSTQIVDTFNAIGKCVVAGGARRSSEIALGSHDDLEFLSLKSDKKMVDRYRWNSNNSVFIPPEFHDFQRFEDNFHKYKELGFVFLHNCQNYGRICDGITDSDSKVAGVNPCGEQQLENYELCNIVETFPARCTDEKEFLRAIKFAYLYAKTVTLTQTPWEITNAIMLRNRRIGLSQSGIQQNITKRGFAEHIRFCNLGYKYIQGLDKKYSDWLCIPRSIRTTTVKPSGSVSLLNGATPGIHYDHAEYYIRRSRFTKESPILLALEKAGYPIEQDVADKYTKIAQFPIKAENYTNGKNETTIWEQMENAAQMQYHWSDNSVSITVDVKEGERIAPALERYQSRLKTISFLPQNHTYEQAPYEEITKEEYEELMLKIKKVDLSKATHEVDEKFCDGEVCQL